MSWITVAEIYDGAFPHANRQAHLSLFRHFLSGFRIVYLNDPIVERFAEIPALLRRRGMPLPGFDFVIAATALQHDLTLLTYNVRHFQRIPDLKLYQSGPGY